MHIHHSTYIYTDSQNSIQHYNIQKPPPKFTVHNPNRKVECRKTIGTKDSIHISLQYNKFATP